MDHIFGTLSTDALKLLYHRVGRHGIQHRGSIAPRDPLPGDPVIVEALTGEDFAPEHAAVYYTTDGSAPDGSRGAARRGDVALMQPVETIWDSLTWRYLTRWQAALPPQADGTTVRYRIGGWTAEREAFADFPDAQRTVERAADAYFNKRPEPTAFAGDPQGVIFSYRVDRLRPPEWAKKMILYHLMVDRFSPGDGRGWTQTEDLNALCGGTLWGAAERIDHIADLGCDAVWLSPIWESPTHHGYDVTDYTQVAAHFGGNDALRRFIDEAHARGIRVILDLVCNHISNQHPFFQEALHNPGSPCRSWFTFDESPLGYRTFFGVASMPQVNLADPGARDWMLDVARYWLSEYDADGYRLDYANGVTPEFWWAFRAACREAKTDSFVFGEIIEAP
ncbi:MAG: alpha-amylase, partial [Anaerolineae bacterium]|nr:alpha-amylase [Anaerolineae bacterium]